MSEGVREEEGESEGGRGVSEGVREEECVRE